MYLIQISRVLKHSLKSAFFSLLFAGSFAAANADRKPDEYGEALSPDKRYTLQFWSEKRDDRETREARLFRGRDQVWAIHFDGPQLYFNWSPSSRFFLAIGNKNPDDKLALHYLDVSAERPAERALNLDMVERRASAEIPLPHTEYLELKRVEWLSGSECLLHFGYRPWRRDPRAVVFALNFADPKPAIKVVAAAK
jgi:hypothetical protein